MLYGQKHITNWTLALALSPAPPLNWDGSAAAEYIVIVILIASYYV